jgi:hypothetical protein
MQKGPVLARRAFALPGSRAWAGPTRCRPGPPRAARQPRDGYFATGMVNSAPLAMLSGQRCITLL